jgi:uncharacterized alpha-E superfamily protein
MLSRVADSIYWMSRYVERAENLARFVDVTLNLGLDMTVGSMDVWQPLVNTTGDIEWFAEHYGTATEENVIRFLTVDADYSKSILSCVAQARENARSIRETISSEMWEQLNQLYLMVADAARGGHALLSPQDFLQEVKQASHLFKGITDAILSRNEGWHFNNLGRMLERADKTSRILDVKYFILLPRVSDVGTPMDDLQWSAVLRSVSGFEMFRKRHHGITPRRIVDFLVLDREFPRAIHHCVLSAEESLHAISGTPEGTFRNAAEQRMGQLRSELAYAQVDDIINRGLHEFLDSLQTKLNEVGDGIYETFIDMRPVETAGR